MCEWTWRICQISFMQNSTLGKLLAVLMFLIVGLGIVLHFFNPNPPDNSSTLVSYMPTNHFEPPHFVVHPYCPPAAPEPLELDNAGQPKIPREKVESWLAKHNRNAMSLLAAFRALDDTNYLNEAATNFPNNPQVELSVLAHDEFPQDRRKWLDLFKNSSPSNSLANYLPAQDYFKSGNSAAAVQELQAASGKSRFDASLTEARFDKEDLYLSAGYSPLDAAKESASGWFQDDAPELATLKQLAMEMGDLQKQYLAAGDVNSAVNLAQMGMNFGDQLNGGDSGKYIINQLVSGAIEANSLRKLDPNTSYDFLDGQTPAQVLQQWKDQKTAFRDLSQNFQAAYPNLTPEEMTGYLNRVNTYGEVPAMQWVIQQHPPNASPNSP
jgi:hypothetical protein